MVKKRHTQQINNLGGICYDLAKLSYGGVVVGVLLPMVYTGSYTLNALFAIVIGFVPTITFMFLGYKLKLR